MPILLPRGGNFATSRQTQNRLATTFENGVPQAPIKKRRKAKSSLFASTGRAPYYI